MNKDSLLVESILQSKTVYIQPGIIGERLIHDLDKPKIIVSVPNTGFEELWNKILLLSLTKKFKKSGLSSKDAKLSAKEMIKQGRDFLSFRID